MKSVSFGPGGSRKLKIGVYDETRSTQMQIWKQRKNKFLCNKNNCAAVSRRIV